MQSLALSGTWECRLDSDTEWKPIAIPGCWEAAGVRKDFAGPVWFRKRFDVPADLKGPRFRLHFGAVSYHCEVLVNNKSVGTHTGAWDAFSFDVTDAIIANAANELLVKVEKPASLKLGPGSEPLAGRFPLKQTLSGFLPYVWGHMFGGIWQDVSLSSTGRTTIEYAQTRASADGIVAIDLTTSQPASVSIELLDPQNAIVATHQLRCEPNGSAELKVPNARAWSLANPSLYTARLKIEDGDEREIKFGCRSIRAAGATILLNDVPIYPRMALSWGWYAQSLHSNPGADRVRADFQKLKSLGYNGVKLCLWFPPQYYFDLADEMGMLLWVELPMWLPDPTDYFKKQTPIEYERLMRQACNHPSVILYTIGCELNAKMTAELLQPLFKTVKHFAGDALVRDNSGSGEAYGGLLNEFAEYYDYHFYSDLPYFQDLLDYFSPRWRPPQPFLFGEFCDHDSFRDLRPIYESNKGAKPWWTCNCPEDNPQGARWQYDVVDHEKRLKELGLWDRGAEFEAISRKQSLLHRKVTLELCRAYQEISGYVVTGEVDTPISTAGMWDDLGKLKFDADEFKSFNDDLAVVLGWDKRRAWINGGDRAAYWDHFCGWSGATIRPHLVVSNYSTRHAPIQASCQLDGDEARHESESPPVPCGEVKEVMIAEIKLPAATTPSAHTLRAQVRMGDLGAKNHWPIWVFPRDPLKELAGLSLHDPVGRLADLPDLCKSIKRDEFAGVVIATLWSDALDKFVRDGGRAILLQDGNAKPGPLPTVAMPFWREALKLIEKHPAWGDFPTSDFAGMQFFSLSTDFALDSRSIKEPVKPILRRLDTRTMAIHDYAAEIELGKGKLIASTLRIEGGHGRQPISLSRSPAGQWLLRCFLRHLQE